MVEAGARSGALTTAAWALEQGRGLYIVPGRLDDPAVAGCLAFLREAGPEARVVAGIPELLEDLGLLAARSQGPVARRRRPAPRRHAVERCPRRGAIVDAGCRPRVDELVPRPARPRRRCSAR